MHQKFNDLYSKQDYFTTTVDTNCTTIIDSLFSLILLSCSSGSNCLSYKEKNHENWKNSLFEKSHIVVSTNYIKKIGYYYKDGILDKKHKRKILAIDKNETISIKLSKLRESLSK